jgi:predicted phosphodiesterase
LIGGPYSNLQATRALFDEAERLDVPAERIICTGDTVAYCADPAATVALLRQTGVHVVMGNCEESIAEDTGDCGCGFEEGSVCAVLSVAWYQHAEAELDADAKQWMAGLPRHLTFEMAGRRLAVVHGSVTEINRFVFASTPASEKAAEIAASGADGVIGGHCGLPFTDFVGDKLWHNAGVIGMPANDGTRRAWYSLLRPRADGIEIELRSFDFDAEAAAARIDDCGLPVPYAESLRSGIWHSTDFRPDRETAQQGIRLSDQSWFWSTQESRAAS